MLDLFAGSGALGIEALSRGAAHATFVDASSAAVAAVRRNLAALGLADRATVHRGDALAFLRDRPASYDVVLLDPPYAFDGWEELLSEVDASTLVIEADRPIEPGPRWVALKRRRYASTIVGIFSEGAQ